MVLLWEMETSVWRKPLDLAGQTGVVGRVEV
jgi:hypothetical protein